jgi:tRNA(His) guanylyltransferase
MTEDTLGDRLKEYESLSTSRKAFRGQPFAVRLDGKAFHTFCRGLKRPYDERLSRLMTRVTEELVSEFGALVGYTQSDEITLGFYLPSGSQSEYPFGGRFQKIESLSAALATSIFTRLLPNFLPEKVGHVPLFDSRAFTVPNLQELYHVFLWRQQDATKNAISMAAQAYYSHGALMGKNGDEKQEMLFQKGVNFNDYPAFFKRGTFVQRTKKFVTLTPEQLEKIPEKHRPTEPVERSVIEEVDIWLSKEEFPIARLFGVKNFMDTAKDVV